MKQEKEQNAFPALHLDAHQGMTLRDYFAAKAMEGLFSSIGEITKSWSAMARDIPLKDYISDYAYEIADAMLKQKEL
jgi:chemotaxis regulatin CheY-phosphate phosphatase CheZ